MKLQNMTTDLRTTLRTILRTVWETNPLPWLCIALLVVTPLAVDVEAYTTFEPVKVWVAVSIGVLILWRLLAGQEMDGAGGKLPRWWWMAFFGYWISLVAATIVSVAPWVSFLGMAPRYQGLLVYGVALLGCIAIMRLKRVKLELVLEFVIFGALWVALLGIGQKFFPQLIQWWNVDNFLGRIFSTMGHPNYLADYLVFVAPLFLWKFLESNRRSRWFWIVAWLVIGTALVLTLSRGALLGAMIGYVFFGVVYGKWKQNRKIYLGVLLAPLVLVFILVGTGRLQFTAENTRSISSRLVMWKPTMELIAKRPLLGYGLDTFALDFAPVAPKELLQTEDFSSYADRAHNFFLDTLVSVGVVGLVFFLIVFGLTIWIVVRSGNILILALGSGLIGHIISQQFEFSLTVHLLYLWAYIGAIWKFGAGERAVKKIENGPAWARVVTILIGGILVAGVWYQYGYRNFVADRLAREGKFAEAFAEAPLRSEYAVMSARDIISKKEGTGEQPLLNFAKYFSGNLDYRPYFYEGAMYQMRHEYSKSFLAYQEAIKRAPVFPQLYKGYGIALLEVGDKANALVQFQKYLDLAPGYMREEGAPPSEARRIFYKLHPDFDEIFTLIQQASEVKK